MTAIGSTHPQDLARNKSMVNTGLIIMSLFIIAAGLVLFIRFLYISGEEEYPTSADTIAYLIGIAAFASYFLTLICHEDSQSWRGTRPYWKLFRYIRGKTDEWISSESAWSMGLALIPLLTIIVVQCIPHRLSAEPGSVRVMYDGRIVKSGESVVSNRYMQTSVLIPLRMARNEVDPEGRTIRAPYRIGIPTATGEVRVNVVAQAVLSPNHAFSAAIGGHERDSNPIQPLQSELVRYLTPYAREIVREVQTGECSGSEAAMLVRMGQLQHRNRDRQPAWAQSITLQGVTIPQWDSL